MKITHKLLKKQILNLDEIFGEKRKFKGFFLTIGVCYHEGNHESVEENYYIISEDKKEIYFFTDLYPHEWVNVSNREYQTNILKEVGVL